MERKGFPVSKDRLRSGQSMTDIAYVDEAADWARRLTHAEARGPGDIENAWRRLETRYGVSFHTWWALRYRKPKDIAASVYFRMRAAYEDACERQARSLAHELAITKAKAGASHPAVVAAETALGSDLTQNSD
jgi:hypothetical protein